MKFETIVEKYMQDLGVNEAVPGSVPVTTPANNAPAAAGTPTGTNNGASVDEIATKSKAALDTLKDVMNRINSGSATPDDYKALAAASTDLTAAQDAKNKLNSTNTPTQTTLTNPLNKPLV